MVKTFRHCYPEETYLGNLNQVDPDMLDCPSLFYLLSATFSLHTHTNTHQCSHIYTSRIHTSLPHRFAHSTTPHPSPTLPKPLPNPSISPRIKPTPTSSSDPQLTPNVVPSSVPSSGCIYVYLSALMLPDISDNHLHLQIFKWDSLVTEFVAAISYLLWWFLESKNIEYTEAIQPLFTDVVATKIW